MYADVLRAVLLAAICVACAADADERAFIEADEITWKVNEFGVARWKTLIGGIEGGQIDSDDVQFGLWELAPGAIYHGHKHEAPEIYYILSGRALWSVGDSSQEVGGGSTVYTRPGRVHRMENLSDEPVRAVWFWWAPGGAADVFSGAYEFTEPAPEQKPGAQFETPSERRY